MIKKTEEKQYNSSLIIKERYGVKIHPVRSTFVLMLQSESVCAVLSVVSVLPL